MTEEELQKIEQTEILLENNGFKINSALVISGLSFEEIAASVDNLNDLKRKMNEGVDTREFTKNFSLDITKIDEVVKKDLYFQNNIGAKDFLDTLGLLQEKFAFSTSYVRAEEILNERLEARKDIMNKITLLDEDVTLSEKEKNRNSLLLLGGRRNIENAILESKKFLREQKGLYEESLKAFNGKAFQEELLATINKLDSESRKLSMEPSNMEVLSSIIRNARDKVVLLGHEFDNLLEFQKQYDALCEKCGISESTEKERKDTVEVTNKEVVEPIVEPIQLTEPTVEPIKKEIKDLYELAAAVRDLNKDVVMEFTNNVLTVENVDDLTTLKLPEGFKYDEKLGINNKVDDLTPYLSLDVTKKTRNLDAPDAEKNAEPIKEEVPKKNGKRHKVKKERKAILAPYVSSTLVFGGLGALCTLCASTGLAPVVPVALVGAGIGAVGQAIYNSMVKDGTITMEDAEKKMWASAGLAGIGKLVKEKSKQLFNILKYGKDYSAPTKEVAPQVNEEPVLEEVPVNNINNEVPSLEGDFQKTLDATLNEQLADVEEEKLTDVNEQLYPELDGKVTDEKKWNEFLNNSFGERYTIDGEVVRGGR